MAKSLKKKVEQRVRKGVKSAGKIIDKLSPNRGGPSAAKVAGVAVAGVAGAAGVVAAVQHFRKSSKGRATLHVRADGDRWIIAMDGAEEPADAFSTKEEALHAARDVAADAAPSELVIHRLDGSVMDKHSYEPSSR
jgi:hypothetical protein